MSIKQEAKNEEGIVIALIDSIATIFRVLKPKMRCYMGDEFSTPVLEAMKDLLEDEDVKAVLRSVHTGYIVSDEAVSLFEGIISDHVKSGKKIVI